MQHPPPSPSPLPAHHFQTWGSMAAPTKFTPIKHECPRLARLLALKVSCIWPWLHSTLFRKDEAPIYERESSSSLRFGEKCCNQGDRVKVPMMSQSGSIGKHWAQTKPLQIASPGAAGCPSATINSPSRSDGTPENSANAKEAYKFTQQSTLPRPKSQAAATENYKK